MQNNNCELSYISIYADKKTFFYCPIFFMHRVKYWIFTWFPGVENFVESQSFRRVSGDSPETLRTLCVSTKFFHHETRWNFGILRNDHNPYHQIMKYTVFSSNYNKKTICNYVAFVYFFF